MVNVYVSVINFNSSVNTTECLRSLEKLQRKNIGITVILIDNASTEPLNIREEEFRSLRLTILRNKSNQGFAGGHNLGITYALKHAVDYVLILNNDTAVDKHLLENLVRYMESHSDTGIAAPKIYFAKGFEFHKSRYGKEDGGNVIWYAGGMMDWRNAIGHHRGVDEVDHGQFSVGGETEFASGCCMLIKKEVFTKVGLFDERYFLYYEDNDFSMRARDHSFDIAYVPDAYLWHKNAGSAGGSGSALQDYFISRNRLLFGMHYAPFRTRLALLRESVRILRTGREWQKKGVRDYYIRRYGTGSYNV